jgi:hypothetical protein
MVACGEGEVVVGLVCWLRLEVGLLLLCSLSACWVGFGELFQRDNSCHLHHTGLTVMQKGEVKCTDAQTTAPQHQPPFALRPCLHELI